MTPKKAIYLIIFLSTANIALNVCSLMELNKEKPLPSLSIPALDSLIQDSKSRDSMIMQVLLLGQHKNGLHENTIIDLCPMCPAIPKKEDLKITEI